MADELPPLAELPAPISPEFVDQLEHSANWARRFGGQDTNIAQRHRHNQDIEQYAAVLQEKRAAAQAEQLLHDKNAQSLYFGMKKLDLQAEEAQARMAHAAELHPLKVQAQKAKIQADLTKERAAENLNNLKATVETQAHADTEAFTKALQDGSTRGIKTGTPEWRELVTTARLAAPGMPTVLFDDIWKSTTNSPLTFEESLAQTVEKKKALMALEPKEPAEVKSLERDRKFWADQLSKAESRRNSASDIDTKKLFDADATEYRQKMTEAESQLRSFREGGTPATAPAAAAPVAAPKAGDERAGYRFKGGNPADKANWEKI